MTYLKKVSEGLMLVAWHLKTWWNVCMTGDEKKRNRTNFDRLMLLVCISNILHGISGEFPTKMYTRRLDKFVLKCVDSFRYFVNSIYVCI